MFNAFVNAIALGKIHWKYYIVYDVFLAFITAIVFFDFPETRGCTLEEVAELFEGNQKAWQARPRPYASEFKDLGLDEEAHVQIEDVDEE